MSPQIGDMSPQIGMSNNAGYLEESSEEDAYTQEELNMDIQSTSYSYNDQYYTTESLKLIKSVTLILYSTDDLRTPVVAMSSSSYYNSDDDLSSGGLPTSDFFAPASRGGKRYGYRFDWNNEFQVFFVFFGFELRLNNFML